MDFGQLEIGIYFDIDKDEIVLSSKRFDKGPEVLMHLRVSV
jgi:hypothetical protein